MNKLVAGNLVHRPLRSLISCLAIAIEVIMILSITAILMGKLDGFKTRQNGIGMDILVRPNSASNLIGMSPAGASVKVADILANVPHVVVAAPVNVQVDSNLDTTYGIEFNSFNALLPFTFLSGTSFQGPYDVIIDDYYADQTKARVGDTITLLNSKWRVSGIMESGKLSHIVFPIDTLRERNNNLGNVNQIYVKVDDPANTQAVIDYLLDPNRGRLEGYPIFSMKEFTSLLNVNNIPALAGFIAVVMGIGAGNW